MATRRPLQYSLHAAWQATVNSHYDDRQINSERSLQALFWQQLNLELPDSRRTFIEPRIMSDQLGVTRRRYPDLVICNRSTVICVIELKYNPRVGPKHKKDMQTLKWIAENRSTLYVENSRYLGDNRLPQRYSFAKRVLFCWASIHKTGADYNAKSLSTGFESLRNSFIELRAETVINGNANVSWSDN